MRRDMDLVRQILLKMEAMPTSGGWHDIHIEGHSEEEIVYHVQLMHEAGLIEAIDLSSHDGIAWRPKRITYVGHEFLDAARNDGVWNKAKDRVITATGSLTLEGLKTALAEVVKSLLM